MQPNARSARHSTTPRHSMARQSSARRTSVAAERLYQPGLASSMSVHGEGEHDTGSDDETGSFDSGQHSFRDEDVAPPVQEPVPADSAAAGRSPQARAVVALKLVLVSFLLGLGVILAVFAYRLLHEAEVSKFEDAFANAVQQALQSLTSGYTGKQDSGAVIAAHVAALTAEQGLRPEQNYLASRFPDFIAAFNTSLNSLAVSRELLWAPLVNATSAPAFRAFAAASVPDFAEVTPRGVALAQEFGIWAYAADGTTAQPASAVQPFYVPSLHIVPIAAAQEYLLLDLWSVPELRHALAAVLQTGLPHQTDMLPFTSGGLTRASSIMFTPIFQDGPFADDTDVGTAIIGFSGVIFVWSDMVFDGLEHAGVTGIVARVTSPNGASQMYSLSGAEAQEVAANHTREDFFESYGTLLTGTFGPGWSVELWPTEAMYSGFVTNAPTIEAVVIAMVVVFLCLVFGVYDYIAATRAALLTRMWQATEAVVADVFPQAIKSRLVQEQLRRHEGANNSSSAAGVAPDGVRGILTAMRNGLDRRASGITLEVPVDLGDALAGPLDGMIADSYPHATVIFADVVGFTEWSGSVTPSEVFRVLEAVFTEFDALAKTYGVFKVETIGDCYMACVGCPDAYEDHAVRAADFALGLADGFARAGEATGVTHLCCRVGLHSGPVVAGVLRAEKHRFQLFGDTVNTASRMESTGEPRRVQCSAATAALLLNSGRHTLRRRGVIAVKGKGSVETFWLTGRIGRGVRRPRSTRDSGYDRRGSLASMESLDDATRRAATAAEDLSTIVAAEAAAEDSDAGAAGPESGANARASGSGSSVDADDAAAEAAALAADAALAASSMAVLVAVSVGIGEDGEEFVSVIIDDYVTIDTA